MSQHTNVPHDDTHYLTAILEASADAIVGARTDGTIIRWSRGAQQIYGYEESVIIGRPLSVLMADETEAAEVVASVLNGERFVVREASGRDARGELIELRLDAAPMRAASGQISGIILIARDITARKQAQREVATLENEARNRAVVLETANRVALEILASRTGVEALRHIADAACVLAGARYAALGVANPEGRDLLEFIAVGLTPDEATAIGPLPHGHGILGLLLNRTEPLRLDVLSQHPESVGFPPHHPPMDSFLGVPIRRAQSTLGSLYLTNKQGGGAFTEADEVAVEALGAHAAVAIHNLHLLTRQRALVKGLITAQEEERRSVAYDLHDGLTQFVMASHAHLEVFRRAHKSGNESKAAQEIEVGLKYLREAVVESRRLINGLRSLALDDMGLAGAVEQLVEEEKARADWQHADFIHNLGSQRFESALETGVYRIVQESLTNARKHSGTTRVEVVLMLEDTSSTTPHFRVRVQDWGCGFDPERVPARPDHVGLQGMVERAHLLDGQLKLSSALEQGTVMEAVFPAPSRIESADDEKIT